MVCELIADPSNKRRWQRRRTRLRPVKILSVDMKFLEDGMCVDISDGGMRISRQFDRQLPKSLVVYDISDKTLRAGAVPWASGKLFGLRFTSGVKQATPAQIKALSEREEVSYVYVRK